MNRMQINQLVQTRLSDLATQIKHLVEIGDIESAVLLRNEGLELAKTSDAGESFFFIGDVFAS